jgi:hypothetical protein
MIIHSALAYSGLLAALTLLVASQSRGFALVASLAAAVEVLMHLQVIHLHVSHLPLGLVLGVALAVPALIAWFRSTTKTAITAGAVAAFVGILQVVGYALPHL